MTLRKGCGLGTPHGEHTWECEDWGRVRCPGRDTGDATGINAKPCGKTGPHPSHLWDAADATKVFRCFGALGPVAGAEVSLFNSSGDRIGGGVTDEDGWINLDDAIAADFKNLQHGITLDMAPGTAEISRRAYEIGTTHDGGRVYASPLEEGRMSKSKKDYTLGEFVEEFGSKFARCNNAEPHESHAWYNDYPGPGGGKNQWWWCGAEPLRRPHEDADPFKPHKFCGKAQEHNPHDWVWDDRPMTSYYCPGEMIEFNPEATLPDIVVDMSPDLSGFPAPPHPVTADEAISILRSKLEPGERRRIEDQELPSDKQEWAKPGDVGYPSQGDPMRDQLDRQPRCPRCGSPDPEKHPAIQLGGEVQMCQDSWHKPVPDERPGEIVRWADRAMFKAEPIKPEDGPKVYLLWMTPDPLGAIAAACKMYKGEVVRSLNNISPEERLEYLEQVSRTKLKAPFEFVKFHFMIEGVTRAFTHQMVRQRTAVYAQESLRFAVVGEEDGGLPVSLPPSLSGLPEDNPQRRDWEDANAMIGNVYRRLVNNGVPAEDARGLLPHNIMTRLHYSTDLRALLDHAGNRLCTQAQFEWRLVFSRIVDEIRKRHINDPMMMDGSNYVFMANELTSLFRPVCFQTGRCEFKANFDRACKIRDRVDAFADNGIGPDLWEEGTTRIQGIKPAEWLLDPGAAREK